MPRHDAYGSGSSDCCVDGVSTRGTWQHRSASSEERSVGEADVSSGAGVTIRNLPKGGSHHKRTGFIAFICSSDGVVCQPVWKWI